MADPMVLTGKRRQVAIRPADPEAVPKAMELIAARSDADGGRTPVPYEPPVRRARRKPGRKGGKSIVRTTRFTPELAAKLDQLAEFLGLDASSVMSVAIADAWAARCDAILAVRDAAAEVPS